MLSISIMEGSFVAAEDFGEIFGRGNVQIFVLSGSFGNAARARFLLGVYMILDSEIVQFRLVVTL